jgi:hypothetical protein
MNQADQSEPGRFAVLLSHVLGVIVPNRNVLIFRSYVNPVGDMAGWAEGDYKLLVQVGQTQLARQLSDLEAIRSRAQFLLTTAMAFVALAVSFAPIILPSVLGFIAWAAGLVALATSALVAAGVIVARKELGAVETRLLSGAEAPVLAIAADAYARAVEAGENTVATEMTVFRDAVALLMLGFALALVAWAIGILA